MNYYRKQVLKAVRCFVLWHAWSAWRAVRRGELDGRVCERCGKFKFRVNPNLRTQSAPSQRYYAERIWGEERTEWYKLPMLRG